MRRPAWRRLGPACETSLQHVFVRRATVGGKRLKLMVFHFGQSVWAPKKYWRASVVCDRDHACEEVFLYRCYKSASAARQAADACVKALLQKQRFEWTRLGEKG